MAASNLVARLIEKHGRSVQITGERTVETYAFIQPLGTRNKAYLGDEYTKIGFLDGSNYLYIGPGKYPLQNQATDCRIIAGDSSFVIVHADTVYLRDEAVYCWAVLCEAQQESAV